MLSAAYEVPGTHAKRQYTQRSSASPGDGNISGAEKGDLHCMSAKRAQHDNACPRAGGGTLPARIPSPREGAQSTELPWLNAAPGQPAACSIRRVADSERGLVRPAMRHAACGMMIPRRRRHAGACTTPSGARCCHEAPAHLAAAGLPSACLSPLTLPALRCDALRCVACSLHTQARLPLL